MTVLRIVLATAQKDFRTAISYRVGFIGSIVSAFWGLIAFRFISKLVNTGQFSGDSVSYFRYTVIGILFVSILEPSAVGTSLSARNEQVQGTLEYLASQPVRRLYLGLSWTAYGFIQSLVVAIAVLLLTIPLGFRVSHVNLPAVIADIILSVIIFAAIGSLGAGIVIVFQQGMAVIAGLLGVLATISGTLFPITELPPWLQAIAHLSPLTYALEALRASLLSNQPSTSVTKDLLILLGFAIVLVPLSAFGLERAFRVAQRRGTLSTF
jgi:ABC-2 type transport system permease protein